MIFLQSPNNDTTENTQKYMKRSGAPGNLRRLPPPLPPTFVSTSSCQSLFSIPLNRTVTVNIETASLTETSGQIPHGTRIWEYIVSATQGSKPLKLTQSFWFQAFAVFLRFYAFGGIPRLINFMCRRFETLCPFQLNKESVPKRRHIKFRRRGIYPKERIQLTWSYMFVKRLLSVRKTSGSKEWFLLSTPWHISVHCINHNVQIEYTARCPFYPQSRPSVSRLQILVSLKYTALHTSIATYRKNF